MRRTALSVLILLGAALLQTNALSEEAKNKDQLYVHSVIDGDTIILSDGIRVRLIGIDTPELHFSNKLLRDSRRSGKKISVLQKMGEQAAGFTKSVCLGRRVRLEYDIEKEDRYGRTLAYVCLDDGTFINAQIIKAGYASVMTVSPNVKYADLFVNLVSEARDAKRGLWKDD